MFVELVKRINKVTNIVWLFFLDLIFPIECLGCGREGSWLCGDCFKEIKFKPKQYCLHCKKENDFGQFCPPCQIIYSLNGVFITALYDELLISRAIKSLKYHFVSGLADDLSKLMILFVDKMLKQAEIIRPGLATGLELKVFEQAKNMPATILNFNDNLIVPVPLSKKRLRWRGFNQAELLAGRVAENYGLELDSKNLVRIKHKKPQAKLDEVHRLENIKDCFVWQGSNLNKKNIILIDDVVTTGATLNECAKVLKANGAGEVWGLVVAKG
ncbi:MAG: ComF family protein [Patescibacteria group bacterium]|nr:ComF family protein [Patescibacteria group bacterium]